MLSLDPAREPITRPVFVWLEVAARLDAAGDDELAVEVRRAVYGRWLDVYAYVALMRDEQLRVHAVLQGWLGEQD